MIVQKLNNPVKDSFSLAYKYFSILSTLNNLNLVKRDCQLLAYAASEKKPISDIKEEFVEKFGTSLATIGNIISKLYALNILQKDKRVVTINPLLLIDFNNDLVMNIKFKHGDQG